MPVVSLSSMIEPLTPRALRSASVSVAPATFTVPVHLASVSVPSEMPAASAVLMPISSVPLPLRATDLPLSMLRFVAASATLFSFSAVPVPVTVPVTSIPSVVVSVSSSLLSTSVPPTSCIFSAVAIPLPAAYSTLPLLT